MQGQIIQLNGSVTFFDYSATDFNCPDCKKQYSDANGKYLYRCNKNVSCCTKIKCECGSTFLMTYAYNGEIVTFKKK